MCGIVAYIGNKQAQPIVIKGLKRLEYRGYDSTGISIYNGTSLHTLKTCLLYTSPSPRDMRRSRMPSSA